MRPGKYNIWLLYGLLAALVCAVVLLCVWCVSTIFRMHGDFMAFLNNASPLVGNYQEYKAFEDSPSGVAMVYVGIITALITFMAFLVPLMFNVFQHRRHSDNREDMAQERFENKFFFYIESYVNIVNNIEIVNVTKGHNSFNYIFYEMQALYFIIKKLGVETLEGKPLSDGELVDISVSILVNGFTPNSKGDGYDIIYSKYADLISRESYMQIENEITSYKRMDDAKLESLLDEKRLTLFFNYAKIKLQDGKRVNWFCGKRSDLVPYFKLIDAAFRFIGMHGMTGSDRDYYLDLLNSQMSDHELALLYCFVNSREDYMGMNREYVEYMVASSHMPRLYDFRYWSKFNS